MLYEMKHYENAEKFLYRVTQLKPDDLTAHKIMRDLYHRRGYEAGEAIEKNILLALGEG